MIVACLFVGFSFLINGQQNDTSIQPTSRPTQKPSTAILTSSYASSPTTNQPSLSPTRSVKENSNQPSSSTFLPSATSFSEQPSSAPTTSSNENNSHQTSYIVTTPSLQPTSSPTHVVEPTLLVGRDYWWVVVVHLQMYGDIASSSFTEFSNVSRYPQLVNRAVGSLIAETLPSFQQRDIVAIATRFFDGGTTQEWISVDNNNNDNQSTTNQSSMVSKSMYYLNTNVKVWTTSISSGQDILLSFETIKQDPSKLMTPLHIAGLTLLNDLHIDNVELIQTSESPSDDINNPTQPLSPSRVYLIIVGTVIGFFVAACFLGYLVSCCRRHPDPLEWSRDIRDRYIYPVGALLIGCLQSWKQLATEGYPTSTVFTPLLLCYRNPDIP